MHAECMQSECSISELRLSLLFSLSSSQLRANPSLFRTENVLYINFLLKLNGFQKYNHHKLPGPQWLPPKSDPTAGHKVMTKSSYTQSQFIFLRALIHTYYSYFTLGRNRCSEKLSCVK